LSQLLGRGYGQGFEWPERPANWAEMDAAARRQWWVDNNPFGAQVAGGGTGGGGGFLGGLGQLLGGGGWRNLSLADAQAMEGQFGGGDDGWGQTGGGFMQSFFPGYGNRFNDEMTYQRAGGRFTAAPVSAAAAAAGRYTGNPYAAGQMVAIANGTDPVSAQRARDWLAANPNSAALAYRGGGSPISAPPPPDRLRLFPRPRTPTLAPVAPGEPAPGEQAPAAQTVYPSGLPVGAREWYVAPTATGGQASSRRRF
jgi:hypothetical protein